MLKVTVLSCKLCRIKLKTAGINIAKNLWQYTNHIFTFSQLNLSCDTEFPIYIPKHINGIMCMFIKG